MIHGLGHMVFYKEIQMRAGPRSHSARWIVLAIATIAICSLPLSAQASPYIYSAQWENGNVNVLDARTFQLRDQFHVGETASWATLNHTRTRLYVLNDVAEKLVILDTRNGSVVNEVPIAGRPINVYVPDDDSRVYVGYWSAGVALVDAIAVVDTLNAEIVHIISGRADAIAVSPDGASLFIANILPSEISAYDTSSYLIRASSPINQSFPKSLRVSPDGGVVYMGGTYSTDMLSAYRADTLQPIFTVPTGGVFGQSLAVSSDGRYVYSVGGNGGMAVIDAATGQLADQVATCSGSDGVALSPDSRFVYVMCPFSYSIDIFDAYTRAPLGSLSNYFTPNSSMDFIGTPPGDILVSNSIGNVVSQILPQSNTAVDFGAVGSGQTDLVVSPSRNWLYVGLASNNSVALISLTFSPPPPIEFIALDSAPDRLAVSPDGRRLYVSRSGADRVSIIDLFSRSVIGSLEFEAASEPRAMAVSADGRKIYVALSNWGYVDVFDTSTLMRSERIYLANGNPSAIVLSADGAFVYVAAANNHLYKIDTATDAVVADWPDAIGSIVAAPGPLGLSPDGSRAYVGLADNSLTTSLEAAMSVLNTATGAIQAEIPLAASPGDIAVDTEGRYIYVSQPTLNSVAVVDSTRNRVVTYITGFNAPGAIADPREPPINFLFRDGFD
jgi:DNA-binding beta-propeller fold protein YncE